MEISGNGSLPGAGLNIADGSFVASNNNSGLSAGFESAIQSFGQEQIESGSAPADADPLALFLEAMAPSLITMVNVLGFDFDASPD